MKYYYRIKQEIDGLGISTYSPQVKKGWFGEWVGLYPEVGEKHIGPTCVTTIRGGIFFKVKEECLKYIEVHKKSVLKRKIKIKHIEVK